MPGFKIVVGGDDAGFDYKAQITKDLKADPRVESVIDGTWFSQALITTPFSVALCRTSSIRFIYDINPS
jgi:hypothetical protein